MLQVNMVLSRLAEDQASDVAGPLSAERRGRGRGRWREGESTVGGAVGGTVAEGGRDGGGGGEGEPRPQLRLVARPPVEGSATTHWLIRVC